MSEEDRDPKVLLEEIRKQMEAHQSPVVVNQAVEKEDETVKVVSVDDDVELSVKEKDVRVITTEFESNKENSAPRPQFNETASPSIVISADPPDSNYLPQDDKLILNELRDALNQHDESKVTFIRRTVRERNEEQWLRLFGMLENRHQHHLHSSSTAHQSDMRNMESQIQRELAEERMTLEKRLAQHKSALDCNKAGSPPPLSPGPSESVSAVGLGGESGTAYSRYSSLDAPVSRALHLTAAAGGGAGGTHTRGVSDPLHQCFFEGRTPLKLATPQDRKLVEDVRLKLEEHRIRDEMRGSDSAADEDLNLLEKEFRSSSRHGHGPAGRGVDVGQSPSSVGLLHSSSEALREDPLSSHSTSVPLHSLSHSHSHSRSPHLHMNMSRTTDQLLMSPDSPYQMPPRRRMGAGAGIPSLRDSPSVLTDVRTNTQLERQVSDLREQLRRSCADTERMKNVLESELKMLRLQLEKVCEERDVERRLRQSLEENSALKLSLHNSSTAPAGGGGSGLSRKDQQLIHRVMEECDLLSEEVNNLRQQLQTSEDKLLESREQLGSERSRCRQLEDRVERLEEENNSLLMLSHSHKISSSSSHRNTPMNGGGGGVGKRSTVSGGGDVLQSLRRSIASLEEQKLIEPSSSSSAKRQERPHSTSTGGRNRAARRTSPPAPAPAVGVGVGDGGSGGGLAERIDQIKQMEKSYDDLQYEKRCLETKLSRCPSQNSSRYNRRTREEKITFYERQTKNLS